MTVEIANVLCDECAKAVALEFPEALKYDTTELHRRCVVFNHAYALCAEHLRAKAQTLEEEKERSDLGT